MSYEYKDYFKELHFNESRKVGSDLNDRFNARDELNEVYAQAAKADEYEAKAKAFDKISDCWRMKGTLELGYFVDKAIRKYVVEYESGEPDAKK